MAKNPDKDKKKIIVLLASAVVIVTVAIAGVKLQWFGNSGDKVEPLNNGIQQEAFYDAGEPETVEDQYKEAIEEIVQSVIKSQTPDVQEVTGVDEDGNISYITSDGDSGLLEDSTSQLAEDWGVSKEEMAANEKNMSEEEYFEWMAQMDEEYNQRLAEAAKAVAQEAQQETQAEVKQPQQTQQAQETQNQQPTKSYQGSDGSTFYEIDNGDGTKTITNSESSGSFTIDFGEGSVGELSDLAKEATVN